MYYPMRDKLKRKTVFLPIIAEIDVEECISNMSYEEVMDLIIKFDLAQANAGFTEELIIKLAKSMKDDLSEEEWKPYEKFIKAIEQANETCTDS